jgi:hypothetical protein
MQSRTNSVLSDRLEDKRTVLKLTFFRPSDLCEKRGISNRKNHLTLQGVSGVSWSKNIMAHLGEDTSNLLFETLEDWNALLERLSPQYEEMSP